MAGKKSPKANTEPTPKKQSKYRDERGVRTLTYRRYKEGIDYEPSTGDELNAILDVCIENFERSIKRGGRPPTFENVQQLQEAIISYFEYIRAANSDETRELRMIPDVEGLCAYMGIARLTLIEWENNNYRGFANTVKAAKNSIAAYKKQLGLSGKIPPLVLAMDLNNNHGYTQKQELVVEPKNMLQSEATAEEIAAKYAELPGD